MKERLLDEISNSFRLIFGRRNFEQERDRQTDGQTDRWTDIQIGKQSDMHTDKPRDGQN